MVVDPKMLNSKLMKYNIWANVFNRISWQQAQTPVQQQPETYKVITNKFPTYDVKDIMWFWEQAAKNQLWFANTVSQYNRLQAQANANTDPNVRYNLTKPELTNKQTLQIQQATPETNEQWLKINKTNSFKDLIIDLQNVANQWRSLEFMKFRELYPEYVENWDKVVDLFESIKSNPQYSAEQVTTTAQKAYPELFGINENYSDKDKITALKKLYDEMVSNKQNGIQLTQQDIIDRYPEYANTEDINTVMEVQDLINNNKKTPTFNDIVANFDSMTKWNVEVWDAEKEQFKKDLKSIDNIFQSTYNWLSDEWKDYVKLLSIAKAVWDAVRQEYWIPESISDRDILQQLKQSDPEYYNELVWDIDSNTTLSEQDRKLLDNNWTLKSAWQSLWRSIVAQWVDQVIQLWKWLLTKIENWELLKWNKVLNTNPLTWEEYENGDIFGYQKMINNNEDLSKLSEKVDTAWKKFLWDLQTELWWMEKDFKNTDMYKKFESESWKKIKTAIKDWDWWAVANSMWWVIGQTLPALVVWYLTKWKWFTTQKLAEFSAFALPSYQRAMEDIESDESLSWLTAKEKDELATRMATIESVIETASLSNMFPWLSEWGGIISRIPWMENVLLRTLVQTQIWAAWESLEEVTQEFFNNLLAKNAWSDRDMWELKDYWDIFTETYLSSQLISTLWWATEWINQAQINSLQKQITEQADLRNKILEWQAFITNDFNEYANAVEVVPWTTTEELQQVWNNTQQKKQELEEKANRITSNSYSNVATPTYQRATVKDTVKPKITANESQQYTDLLDEMIKNKEISEDDRKRVEKTLWVFTLNTKEEQDNKIWQQTPSWLANINQNSNTNTEEKSNIISRWQNQLVQNYNRMNPKAIDDFKDQFKQDYGQFLVDRWFTKAWEDNLNDLVQYADTLLKLKDKALEPMQWRYQDRSLEDMLEMVVDRARNTKDYKKIEEYEKLLQKYNEWWIEVSEILSMMRWFNYKIKTWFFKEQNSEKLDLATNVYMATRDFLDKTAKENWLDSLDKLNREIRAVEHIIWWVTYKLQWSSANNMLWLNDYIALWAVVANPEAFAFALTKLALKNWNVRNLVLRLAVGKRWNSKNRITESKLNDELNKINSIADQKKRDAAVKDFNERYWIDNLALPYKEWYNGTPTTTITVTPEWLSKTQWNVNTPNSEQKSQWLSETQKNSETENNTNEEVQDSIQDFLVWVWANETKQDLWNITTADYKNMSRRWLEQLLESDKIPAEEAKKITEELDWRKVKEESNEEWWWYLDHYYAYKINQLQEEEQRIGKVWNKKVNKSYAEEQMKAWEKKKEKLKEDMAQDYWDKDINRVEDKYGELESKPIDYINEWTKSKKFVVDEAEQQVIKQLQENWNKINRFELNMTEEEKKVREDILWKVSDLYETKSTDYGDSFVSRTNRDNRWIIYRDDGRVNVNSLDTLKSSGLYDVLPDDTKITISWQEQTTLWELKKQPQGLAEVSNTQDEQEVEWLANVSERPTAKQIREYTDSKNYEDLSEYEAIDRELRSLWIETETADWEFTPEMELATHFSDFVKRPWSSDINDKSRPFTPKSLAQAIFEYLKNNNIDDIVTRTELENWAYKVDINNDAWWEIYRMAERIEKPSIENRTQVEWLAKINEQIAKEEQDKKAIEEWEQATLKEKAEAQKTIDNEIADEQNDIVKEIDQKELNDMEFTEQELNDLKKWFEETEKQWLAAISVKVENGKVVKESEVDTDRKEQAKIARDNYTQETKGMNKSEKIARVKDIINTLNELSNRLAGTKNSWPTIEKLQMQVDEFNNILSELEWKKETERPITNNSSVNIEPQETVEWEFETLPADVSVSDEEKQIWSKRIAPDRVPRQQTTYQWWIDKVYEKVKTIAEYMRVTDKYYSKDWHRDQNIAERFKKLRTDVQNILYWNEWFRFTSDKSKEFKELWKNISDNKMLVAPLKEIAKNFYITRVKKDISKWYVYPQEVLDQIPWAEKAVNARQRYEKWLDTSFSAKDNRIDYSEKDVIWAWIKSQDGKQVTNEQKQDIVKWIQDFGRTMWLDMKKFAEDRWLVYVHLHGWQPFLTKNAAWLYREWTNAEWEKNISVSVWGAENIRYKDKKTKERKTETLNTTMSHELWHAMDYLVDKRLLSWEQKSILRTKFNPVNRLYDYYSRPTEITARAIEQYVAIENWQADYYEENWNLDAGEFKWTDMEYYLKEIWSYYERPWYWNKSDYENYVKPYVEEAFKNNFNEYKTDTIWWKDINQIKQEAVQRWLAEISNF